MGEVCSCVFTHLYSFSCIVYFLFISNSVVFFCSESIFATRRPLCVFQYVFDGMHPRSHTPTHNPRTPINVLAHARVRFVSLHISCSLVLQLHGHVYRADAVKDAPVALDMYSGVHEKRTAWHAVGTSYSHCVRGYELNKHVFRSQMEGKILQVASASA